MGTVFSVSYALPRAKATPNICRFVDLSICRFVDLSICRFVNLSICRFVDLSICKLTSCGSMFSKAGKKKLTNVDHLFCPISALECRNTWQNQREMWGRKTRFLVLRLGFWSGDATKLTSCGSMFSKAWKKMLANFDHLFCLISALEGRNTWQNQRDQCK